VVISVSNIRERHYEYTNVYISDLIQLYFAWKPEHLFSLRYS